MGLTNTKLALPSALCKPVPGSTPRCSLSSISLRESVGFALCALAEGRLIMTGCFAPPEQRDGDFGGFSWCLSLPQGWVPLGALGPSLGTAQAEPEVKKLFCVAPLGSY